ncbi:hypothetical protein H072_10575 [Dactylellina haptotyla CBS 200.50]|uniref:Major facilitator superfamily (MFS) profile domain-containing protein n=1 Tax=Dactylellina haptotyla (strain CBS 200.50) TaxID=1284197 RepID=S8BA26_DACHA|nr:hypothetical protein H072_10575 [Dactylellina haptotyla CBS 200.50]
MAAEYGAVDDRSSSKRLSLVAESEADTVSISSDGSCQYSTSSLLNADEETRLFHKNKKDTKNGTEAESTPARLIAVLLLGVFISNADGSFVLATNGVISSEFGRLSDASWLVTSYLLSMCALQPLYGKLSDIYGRKTMLLISYTFFGVGCIYSGIAQSLAGVIIGRAVSGIGGAGMMALVSILITDLVPQREIAAWRAYVNIAATTGRSLGGPVGGYLTDTVGWRWSFAGQAPLIGIAAILVAIRLHDPVQLTTSEQTDNQKSKLSRVDILGSFLLATTIVGVLLVLDLGGQKLPWDSPYIAGLFILSFLFLVAFCFVEIYVASEPVFPLHLLRKNCIAASYGSLGLSTVSQIGIMYTVPRYFQITRNSSVTAAGAQLIPAVVGNVVGGLLTGIYVQRTGRYKLLLTLAGVISSIASTLLILRWNGHTGFLESLYIFPGGFGMGLSQASSFVAMTAGLEKEHYAVATGGLYLSSNIGAVAGVSIVSVVLENAVRTILGQRLIGPGSKEIIEKAIKDVEYIGNLKGDIREIVVSSYVTSLKYSYSVTLFSSIFAFIIGLTVQEKKLD